MSLIVGCGRDKDLPDYYDIAFASPAGPEVRLRAYADRPFVLLFRDDVCSECDGVRKRLQHVRIVTVHTGRPDPSMVDTILDPDLTLAQILRVEATPALCLMSPGLDPLCLHDLSEASIVEILKADRGEK